MTEAKITRKNEGGSSFSTPPLHNITDQELVEDQGKIQRNRGDNERHATDSFSRSHYTTAYIWVMQQHEYCIRYGHIDRDDGLIGISREDRGTEAQRQKGP